MGPFPAGELEMIDNDPCYKLDIAKIEEFVGRQIDMQEIIKDINNNRLMTIIGLPGIGKTAMVKCVAHHL